jgi:hypothetical protein
MTYVAGHERDSNILFQFISSVSVILMWSVVKYIVTWRLMAGIVEPDDTFIARQRHDNHVPSATNTQATLEGLLGNGIFCWVRPEAM